MTLWLRSRCPPLGIIAAGIAYEMIGYRATLMGASLTVIIPSLAAFAVRDVRHMTNSR
jgi:hypothetical protein